MASARLLGWNDAALELVRQHRGWTPEALARLAVGWDGQRALIPVHEQSGELLGHLRYDPLGQARPKMKAEPGIPRELFPIPEMIEEEPLTLLLLEGEPDCIRSWSLGFPAIAVPGTHGWRSEWAWRFRSRDWTVTVVFDCDTPGRTAAQRIGDDLMEAGVETHIANLDPWREDGYDFTDWTRDHA